MHILQHDRKQTCKAESFYFQLLFCIAFIFLVDFSTNAYPASQELSSSQVLVEVDPYLPTAGLWKQSCLDMDANFDVNSTSWGPHTANKPSILLYLMFSFHSIPMKENTERVFPVRHSPHKSISIHLFMKAACTHTNIYTCMNMTQTYRYTAKPHPTEYGYSSKNH